MKIICALFFSISICAAVGQDSWKGTIPDGYLLGFKVLQIDQPSKSHYYNHASLFKIQFDGMVTELWNYSYNASDVLFSENLFAVDPQNELVYLGSADLFLALDLNTGEVKIEIPLQSPNLQYFWSYDYFAKDKAIYGVCTGQSEFDWCSMKQIGANNAHLKFLYQMPYTNEYGPTNYIYYLDKEDQTIWYYPSYIYQFAIGVNYTTGRQVFTSTRNPNGTTDYCIAHDHATNRVFTFTATPSSTGLGELLAEPHQRKMLLELQGEDDLRLSTIGTCAYDPKTHTMIGLMSSQANYMYHAMPTSLLLIDTVSLTFRIIPLPAFQEKWDSGWPVTAMKFVPNT